jgi:hypothetical protein
VIKHVEGRFRLRLIKRTENETHIQPQQSTFLGVMQQEPLIQIPLDQQLQHALPSSIQQDEGDVSQSATQNLTRHNDGKPRRTRSKWTPEETQDLIKGCGIHGVGSWKK